MMLRSPADAGSAVPLVVGLVAVGVALALAVASLAGESARMARAQSIADVVALQAAFAERRDGTGCVVAGAAAAANVAVLVRCGAVASGDVVVTIRVGSGATLAEAAARAGPAFAP